jgi:hypothetical protein
LTYKNAEVGLNLGFGVMLLKHLQVGANYNMALTESAKADVSESVGSAALGALNGKTFKSKVWQVSVAYIF